jgi:glycosyltransferase involved in cell wall biosynthesis
MRILLLSAYDAHSHRRWRQGLVAAFPKHDWTVLALPPRNFSWRIRGNSLSWALAERAVLEQPWELLIATSMTDLSALKGMVPSMAAVPSLVYCHENQFAYPARATARDCHEPKMVNLYTALAADRVLFNSEYNRQSFLQGVQAFLDSMPDAVPPGVVGRLAGNSSTLPVPLEADWFTADGAAVRNDQPFTVVWNHRWEYDKGPERLFGAVRALQQAGADFRLHVVGQQFRRQPPVFADMYPLLKDHIGTWGMVESESGYRRLLQQSHVVLSTALHEFQGLALLEATACGCIPLAPDRLAYPEFVPAACRYPSFPDEPASESDAIAARLLALYTNYQRGALPGPPDVTALSWMHLRQKYETEIDALCGSARKAGRTGFFV